MKNQLVDKIHAHSARIAVIGLGYVGLPLAVAFAEAGFSVVGIDVASIKVGTINAGRSFIGDILISVNEWRKSTGANRR